jgi:hypothetical protein
MGLQCSSRAPRVPTDEELLQLHKVEFLLRRPFNADTEVDLDKLRDLWGFFSLHNDDPEETSTGDTEAEALRRRGSFRLLSTAWKNIGFQQENPLQDIRSGGTLAICNLDFFFHHYPGKVRAMCQRQQAVRLASKYRRGYPFATASINVTRMICVLFSLVNKYGARQPYESVKLPYWHLLLAPDTDPFQSVSAASSSSPPSAQSSGAATSTAATSATANAAATTAASSSPPGVDGGDDDGGDGHGNGHGDGDGADDGDGNRNGNGNGRRRGRSSRSTGSHAGTATATTNAPVVRQVHLRQHIDECLNPVHELYCTAFVLLDREFRRADALNMEFNLVLDRTHELMRDALLCVLLHRGALRMFCAARS